MHLKINQANAIRDKLINDRKSTYEEMLDHFVNVIGITEGLAKEYLCSRHVYLNHPEFQPKKKVRKKRKQIIQPVKETKNEIPFSHVMVAGFICFLRSIAGIFKRYSTAY